MSDKNLALKAPTVVSITKRKLRPGFSFQDFQNAHLPKGDAQRTQVGVNVKFFDLPVRVINAVSAEDPTMIYSISLNYGKVEEIFQDVMNKIEIDREHREKKLSEVAEEIEGNTVAFVLSDNEYGGQLDQLDSAQEEFFEITNEIVTQIKHMKKDD